MNSINDFYTKIDINADAVDRIIATSKTAKPHKTVNRIAVIVSTCAAALVIGIFSLLMFQMTNVTINETNNLFTYSNIEKFEGDTVGGDTLQSHDGIALWINAAYFNGHKMYVAVKGECLKSDWTDGSLPDILKYTDFSDEQAYFSINDIPVKPVGDEIVLTKNRKYYEGVVQFDFENEESLVYLKMNLPTIDAYYDGTFTKTVLGPFDMSNVISRTYTVNEEKVLNGNDEMYVKNISVLSEASEQGLYVECFVPAALIRDMDIKVAAYDENSKELALIDETQLFKEKEQGYSKCFTFATPSSKKVHIVLYDARSRASDKPLQEYDVTLNNPQNNYNIDLSD